MPDPYDVLTIAALVDELNETIGNGRIQRIGLFDARSVGAEIYAGGRRHYLLMSADDRNQRFHLTPEMPSLDPALRTPFGLLLRKYIRGGIILGIDQPPLERIAKVSIAKRVELLTRSADTSLEQPVQDDEPEGDTDPATDESDTVEGVRYFTLYVELMGRHSNLILVDEEHRIVESAKRVTTAMSRVRRILPRLEYQPPPPPDRLDPRAITPELAERFLMEVAPETPLSRAFVTSFRGISPQMASEICFNVTGSTDVRLRDVGPSIAPALAEATLELLSPLGSTTWSPRTYREETSDGAGAIVACSPVPMAHLAARYVEIECESISSAVAAVEGVSNPDIEGRHLQRRQRLLAAVTSAREKAERRLVALANEVQRATEADHLRLAGETIYASLWQIAPGQRQLDVEGAAIALDPQLTAQENAQSYFERYRKAQSANAYLPQLEDETRTEIAYLDQLATLIAQAPGFSELEALAAEWGEQENPARASSHPRRKSGPRRPPALTDDYGNVVYVGHSGPQNDLITFELAGPDDLWLHARGVPGSHVIVRQLSNAQEAQATVTAAAALAAWYSAARRGGSVEVDVAPRRHVRKLKGGKPGMVTYRNEDTIRVQPKSEIELRDVLKGSS